MIFNLSMALFILAMSLGCLQYESNKEEYIQDVCALHNLDIPEASRSNWILIMIWENIKEVIK